MRENHGYGLVYFMLGGLTGASLALLFTPRPGRETRELVTARMRDGERVALRGLERGRQVVVRTVREGRQIARRSLQRGRGAAEPTYPGAEAQRDPAPAEKLT